MLFSRLYKRGCAYFDTASLVLSWLVFGRSFETMADALTSIANDPSAGTLGRLVCSYTIKHVIEASIKSGYRTHESWREYVELHESITRWLN